MNKWVPRTLWLASKSQYLAQWLSISGLLYSYLNLRSGLAFFFKRQPSFSSATGETEQSASASSIKVEVSARLCEAWSNHSDHLHNYQSSCLINQWRANHISREDAPEQSSRMGRHNWSTLILLSFNSANFHLCLVPLPILYWFLKLHSPLRSSLHKRL